MARVAMVHVPKNTPMELENIEILTTESRWLDKPNHPAKSRWELDLHKNIIAGLDMTATFLNC